MIRKFSVSAFLLLVMALPGAPSLQAQTPGRNVVTIRGQKQDIYYYPANNDSAHRKVLFACGDGGWRGWAITLAQQMASWGYDVYGLDTKTYLSSFTGNAGLKENDVMNDFRQLKQWMAPTAAERVTLVGWSAGAGLEVLAAAANENKAAFTGLITFGLADENVLGWCWKDNLTYVTKGKPDEPTFRVSGYLGHIAPLPFWLIQSDKDEYVSLDETKRLTNAVKDPKRISIISANNHRFDGNTQEFYRALREGLQWMK